MVGREFWPKQIAECVGFDDVSDAVAAAARPSIADVTRHDSVAAAALDTLAVVASRSAMASSIEAFTWSCVPC